MADRLIHIAVNIEHIYGASAPRQPHPVLVLPILLELEHLLNIRIDAVVKESCAHFIRVQKIEISTEKLALQSFSRCLSCRRADSCLSGLGPEQLHWLIRTLRLTNICFQSLLRFGFDFIELANFAISDYEKVHFVNDSLVRDWIFDCDWVFVVETAHPFGTSLLENQLEDPVRTEEVVMVDLMHVRPPLTRDVFFRLT